MVSIGLAAAASDAQTCSPAWTDRFTLPDNGLDGPVRALASFDPDGTGPVAPSLYVGGLFTRAGTISAKNIVRWNGQSWASLGGANGSVQALEILDDDGVGPNAPALYAGGFFTTIGPTNVSANHVAKWDGSTWSRLGDGLGAGGYPVYDLAIFDDGSGPALYAAGAFYGTLNRIAKWSGSSWLPLGDGSGLTNTVYALEPFNGSLYAAGVFTQAGGKPANNIARWNGSAWSPLLGGTNDGVHDLRVFDDGSGPALYATGVFTEVYNQTKVTANYVARWNGQEWSALDTGFNATGEALAIFRDGTIPRLYAGGLFTEASGVSTNHVAQWNGSTWVPLGGGLDNNAWAIASFDAGSGPALYVGGEFTSADAGSANPISAGRIAEWVSPTSPVITQQPANQTGCVGEEVCFSVTATGATSYQWQSAASCTGTFSNISGATSAQYCFTAALGDSGKGYQVVVTNSCGSTTSHCATLTLGAGSPDGVVTCRAVVVGISDYPGTANDLDYAAKDAQDFRTQLMLDTRWSSSNMALLTNSQATRAAIQSALQSILAAADADDVCVFYYAGHGRTVTDAVPLDEADNLDETLCVYDGDITDDELSSWTCWTCAGVFAVFLDSCFSGGAIRMASPGLRTINPAGPVPLPGDGFATDLVLRTRDLNDCTSRIVVSTACDDDELSVESPIWQHGLYTHCLLNAMSSASLDTNSNGELSIEEAQPSISLCVTAANPNQHPQLHDGNGTAQAGFVAILVCPVIADVPNGAHAAGTAYTGPTPTLTQGTTPVIWSLVSGPTGMTINASTGVVSWPTPTATGSPFTITIRATNSAGYDDETWTLTVNVPGDRTVSLVCGAPTATVNVTVVLASGGNENVLGFSINYDSAVLTYVSVVAGPDTPQGTTLIPNPSQPGRLGLLVGMPFGQTFQEGSRQVAVVTFSLAGCSGPSTDVSFGDQPIIREVTDALANPLTVSAWQPCSIFCCSGPEGDVAPRASTGSSTLSPADWTQVGRFVAGLDTANPGCEFQKADCAPRSCGNGGLTPADWTQAGRYVAGLDLSVSPACGPSQPGSGSSPTRLQTDGHSSESRAVRVVSAVIRSGQTGCVKIAMDALGDENTLGFSLCFDPARLTFTAARLCGDDSGLTLIVNPEPVQGRVGILLGTPPGQVFVAGTTCLLEIQFQAVGTTGIMAKVAFCDQPVLCELVDAMANTLPTSFQSGRVRIGDPVRFDYDADDDVDRDDLDVFGSCVSGPSITRPPASDCSEERFVAADADSDADVDQSDFGIFQRCYSGPGKPADPDCSN